MLTSLKSCGSPCTWHWHHACCRETPDFIPPEVWPPNSPDLNPVDYSITVWTVVQIVLTATFNSYGDEQISTPSPHKITTTEPIDKKFRTTDYVREGTHCTKFGTNSPSGGFWAKYFFNLYYFFSDSPTGQICWWIFTRGSSKDVKSRKDVPFFRGYKT